MSSNRGRVARAWRRLILAFLGAGLVAGGGCAVAAGAAAGAGAGYIAGSEAHDHDHH